LITDIAFRSHSTSSQMIVRYYSYLPRDAL